MSFKPWTTGGGVRQRDLIGLEHCESRALDRADDAERAQPRTHQCRLANAEFTSDVDMQAVCANLHRVSTAGASKGAAETLGVHSCGQATLDHRRSDIVRHLECLA